MGNFEMEPPDEPCPDCGSTHHRACPPRRPLTDTKDGVSAAELQRVKLALGDAAREIDCAGPVDHRIRVLKKEFSEALASAAAREKRLREALQALIDAPNREDRALWIAARAALAEGGSDGK